MSNKYLKAAQTGRFLEDDEYIKLFESCSDPIQRKYLHEYGDYVLQQCQNHQIDATRKYIYQPIYASRAYEILVKKKIVYLMMEMRVGKTSIALQTAKLYKAKNVLFVSQKKALNSITGDFQRGKYNFKIKITNFAQISKLKPEYDLIIVDEAHSFGAFPKPSQRTMHLQKLVGNKPLILCSGTASPESESQLFHQFWLSDFNPFNLTSFYKWAKIYVNVKETVRNGYKVNDYSHAKRNDIMRIVEPYIIRATQKDVGFTQSEVIEHIINVPIDPNIEKLVKRVMTSRYFKFRDDTEIICDTPVKLQSKIHQIYSGTVKTECGKYKILDESKAKYIANSYVDKKIAIFYKFVAEGEALKKHIPNWTDSPEEFRDCQEKTFICQISSGSMGTDLSKADILIFYNIDFSAVQYWQSRMRLSNMQRVTSPVVHWIFSQHGIENKIHQTVMKKKDYTLFYFMRDFGNERVSDSTENNQVFKAARVLRNQNHYNKSGRSA